MSGLFSTNSSLVDRFGMVAAIICVVHCLTLPFLGILLISDTFFFQDESFHVAFAAVTVFILLISVIKGYSAHKSKIIIATGLLGAILICGNLLAHMHGHEGHHGEHHLADMLVDELATILGGFLVVIYHVLSIRKQRHQKLDTESI